MRVEKIEVKSCCGKRSLNFKFNLSVDEKLLSYFKDNGWTVNQNFLRSGIANLDGFGILMIGTIGGSYLQLLCKQKNCDEIIDKIESLLINYNAE